MTRVQNIAGLEPTWIIACDAEGCVAQQSLIADRDAASVAAHVHGMNAERVAWSIAFGRGWVQYPAHTVPGRHSHKCASCAASARPFALVHQAVRRG